MNTNVSEKIREDSKVYLTDQQLNALDTWDYSKIRMKLNPANWMDIGVSSPEQCLRLMMFFAQAQPEVAEILQQFMAKAHPTLFPEPTTYYTKEQINEIYLPLLDRVELGFKQFMVMAFSEGGEEVSPSLPVDMFWHTFILETEMYENFSQAVAANHL